MTVLAAWAAEGSSGADSPATDLVGVLGGALVLVVPGYVLGRVAGRAGREPDASDPITTARLASGSILVHVLMLPLTYLLADSVLRHGAADYTSEIFAWLIGTVFVVPCLLGGGAVWLAHRPEGTRSAVVARALGFASTNRFVYAWSATFADLHGMEEAPVVRVRLRDGREVRGSFARRAHASEDPGSRDLFLDRLYGAAPPLPGHGRSGGIWINGEDIVTVEFFFKDAQLGTDLQTQRKESPMTDGKTAAEEPGSANGEQPEAAKPVPRQPRYRTFPGVPAAPAEEPKPEEPAPAPSGEKEKR